jgi:glycosyltransferase involved in cell wall biosynthesis
MRMNLAGYKFLPQDGYGRLSLKTVQALLRNGHEVYPFDISSLKNKPAWFLQAQGLEFDRVTIQFMPPDMMVPLPGRSISVTMHESLALPPTWAEKVNQSTQWMIVPHRWLVPVFQEAGVEVPIAVVNFGIDPDECAITTPNRNRPFAFGCLADRGGRKGHWLVHSAFYKAFDFKNKDVRLLVKGRPSSLSGMDASFAKDTRLTFWRTDVDQIADIYAQFDAFLFPTNCEGFGMPPREAAACGVPTVVTNWSGTEDETDKWAIPLNKFTFVESGMQGCGGEWAQPDEDELIHWMRWLYNNRDEARRKALAGAAWLRQNRTYAQAADNLVKQIGQWFGAYVPPTETLADHEALAALTRESLARLDEELSEDGTDVALATPKMNGRHLEVVR